MQFRDPSGCWPQAFRRQNADTCATLTTKRQTDDQSAPRKLIFREGDRCKSGPARTTPTGLRHLINPVMGRRRAAQTTAGGSAICAGQRRRPRRRSRQARPTPQPPTKFAAPILSPSIWSRRKFRTFSAMPGTAPSACSTASSNTPTASVTSSRALNNPQASWRTSTTASPASRLRFTLRPVPGR